MISWRRETKAKLDQWIRTKAPLPTELYRPEFVALVRRGLDREIVNPYMYVGWPESQTSKFAPLHTAVNSYAVAAERSGNVERQLGAYWDLLRLTNEQEKVVSPPGGISQSTFQWESMAIGYFWRIRMRLSPETCRELLADMIDYDKRRDTWDDKCARQRLFDANADWETRLHVILAGWSGRDLYPGDYWRHYSLLQLRLLISDLAIRSFQMKYGTLPKSLAALAPEFLLAVPTDPVCNGPIIYRPVDGGYKIYSVGADLDDDGGVPTDKNWYGDFTTELMFQ
jgi:hypothetical protein